MPGSTKRVLALGSAISALALLANALAPSAPAAAGLLEAQSLDATGTCPGGLQAGAAARTVTPVDPVTGKIWAEPYTDANGNGRYDAPDPLNPGAPFDPFEDTNANGKWDGPFMAGYGHNRNYYTARGVHDDVWARAIVLRCGDVTVALVSLDVVGFFREEALRVKEALKDLGLTHLVLSATHTHDSIDTMGLWGPNPLTDGKDPRTQAHVRARSEEAVRAAAAGLEPVRVKLGAIRAPVDFGFLQTDLRDPFVIDDVILTAQYVRADGSVVATVVNWSPHPETIAGTDDLISSDFPDVLRKTIEEGGRLVRGKVNEGVGGVAVYFSGAVGGMMTTLRARVYDEQGREIRQHSYAKADRIGELAGVAALESVAKVAPRSITSLRVQMQELFVPGDNAFLLASNALGVFDHPLYFAPGVESPPIGPTGLVVPAPYLRTEVGGITLYDEAGRAAMQVATIPGEILPELAIGGYLQATDTCYGFSALKKAVMGGDGRERIAAANPRVPTEPVIRDHMQGEFKFLFGLANDELGYIIPANDFTPATVYPVYSEGTDRCGDDDHYEETNAASSKLAPMVTKALAAMFDPAYVPPDEPTTRIGFLSESNRPQSIPGWDTRGVWVDTNADGAYEENEDAYASLGALRGLPQKWGFLDSRGRDMGSDPRSLEGRDPRGVWIDFDGDGAWTPGRDAVVFADAFAVGDDAIGDTWP